MSNSRPVWHDIFRKVTLKPDNITLTAETYEDTLNIVRGPGVNFGDETDISSDTFEINVDYKLKIPLGSTSIRLEDVNTNYTDIDFTAGRGIAINRTGSNELEFQAFGVTETDTLQTVTSRGNISDKDLYMNNLTVGKIISSYPGDGFTTTSSSGPTITGTGTLGDPVKFTSTTVSTNDASDTVVINLSAPGIGTFGYQCDFQSTLTISSGNITLERQNPSTLIWEFLENESGTAAYTPLVFQNFYSELYNGPVNYRITISWSGNTDSVSYRISCFFESGGIIEQPLFQTNSDLKTVLINDLQVFQNNIRSINSSSDIVFQPSGTGTVVVDTDQALRIPFGSSTVRPAGEIGQIRFNTSDNQFEGFNGTIWSSLGSDNLGNRIYVSQEKGNDSNNGINAPVATVKKAVEIAGALAEPIFMPPTSSYDARDLLESNIAFIKAEVIGYINYNVTNNVSPFTSSFVYDQTVCSRDVGLILESVYADLLTGTNEESINAGNRYYAGTAALVISSQKAETVDAINYIKYLAGRVLNNLAPATSYQGVETQTIDLLKSPSSNDKTTVADLFDVIVDIVNLGLDFAPSVINPFQSKYDTRDLLQENKSFIRAEVIAFINYNITNTVPPFSPIFTYNEETCSRDVGYIVEAAAFDTLFGGNANSRFAGLRHYYPTASVVISSQKAETVAAINYAKTVALAVLNNTAPVTLYQSSVVQKFDLTKVPSASDKTSVGDCFDIVSNIVDNGVGVAPALVEPNIRNPKLAIFIASGDYEENNPILLPDNVTLVGDNLRSVLIRPKNANKDLFRLRNNNYITNLSFRDKLRDNVPYETFRYAVSFDNIEDSDIDRTAYQGIPSVKPLITISPYIQNVSLISFLGGSGAEINGDLVFTPNTPKNQIEAENPVSGPAPEQGKSMVANAFTILTFGGNAWRVINDAYAQIVSCFVIFAEQGDLTQNGGYLSVTNSATNFGLFALRSSGYSPSSFAYDRGWVNTNGVSGSLQSLKVVGFERAPLENYVIKIKDPSNVDITDNFNSNSTLGIQESFTASISTVGGNTITFAAPHAFTTGDRVEYDSNGNREIVGIFSELTYYVSASSLQISLFHDEALQIPVRDMDASVTSGTHYFRAKYEEFYINEVLSEHNEYQDIILTPGSYTCTIGDAITGINGINNIAAIIVAYDAGTYTLTVSIEQVQVGQALIRNYFAPSSQINAGFIDASAVTVVSVTNRADLWTSEFTVKSTQDRSMQGIANTANQQIHLHRPSICNSSAHTWEFCGAGTDYNALPQNGGRTITEFEQYQDLPGRVYTSGTNELGDFKIGTQITAFNRTGNIVFNNKVSIGQLDSLSFSLSGGVKITEISTDIELGDSEIGGPSNNRLTTQLAQKTFLNNRLGSFINKSVSTDSVPGAVVQLNSSGLINPSLVPSKGLFNAYTVTTYKDRLYLYEKIPVVNLAAGDIVTEKYNQNVLTLTGSITVVEGETITQAGSGAQGKVKDSGTSSSLTLIEPLVGTFNTVGQLTGSTSGALGANSVPTVVSGVTEQTDNYFLANALLSQYLILDPSTSPTFTAKIAGATKVTGATTGAVGTPTEHRVGVMTSLNVGTVLPGGSGYLTPGTYNNVSITNISGTGTGAKANVTVDVTGKISGFTIYRGGTGYAVGNIVSVSDASVGGRSGGSAIQLTVTSAENRLYVELDPNVGIAFVATGTNIEYITDDSPGSLSIANQASTSEQTFSAADVGVGGNVNYASSYIVFGSAHGYVNGDPVVYDSNGNIAIGGLTNLNTYYIKYINTTTVELYTTYDLLPANKVSFTGSSTGNHKLRIEVINTNAERIYSPAHGLITGSAIQYTSASTPGGIVSGQYFFVGGVTTNSFTLHPNRGNALSSVNGLIVAAVNITSTGSGSASLIKQNVIINSVVNTSGKNSAAWSNLSNTTITAENIVSGVVNPSRLGSGTANTDTFLRGDSSWQYAVAGIKNTVATDPITLTGSNYLSGSDTIYYGIVDIKIEKTTQGFPVAGTGNETLGIAKFAYDHFVVDSNGLVTTKGSSSGGVIDAATLSTQPGSYYSNPINLSRAVPIEKGGTNLSSYTQGDMLYAASTIGAGGYTESLSKLGIGVANSVLTSSGTVPQWSTSLNLSGSLTIGGNLIVNGTTTTVNSTTISVDDKNIELGSIASPTDTTADGGGITLKGTTDKTINWIQSTGRWTFNQPVEATSIQNTPIGSSTRSSGAFTTLDANGNVGLSPTGTVTINPSVAGTINNMSIGATTRAAGNFTTLDANGNVGLSPTGTVTINPSVAGTINNMSIGATTRAAGNFTTLNANGNVGLSPTGTVTINPSVTGSVDNVSIGSVVAGTGAFTTLSASSTVSGSGFSTYLASPPAIGSSSANTGSFTSLNAAGVVSFSTAANNQSYTTTGAGTISITSGAAGSINNMRIGNSTAASGAFTTLSASSTVSGTGFSTYMASPPAIGSTAANTGAFTTLSASSTVSGTGFSTYMASPPAIGSTAANTGAFTTLSASSTVSGTGFSTYLASPPAIGSSTANTGAFTTITASSTISATGKFLGNALQFDTYNTWAEGAAGGAGIVNSSEASYQALMIVGNRSAGGNRRVRVWDEFYVMGTVAQINGNQIWHAGNDGSGSGLDADLLDGYNQDTANTANTIVRRDASGNFSAGTMTGIATEAYYADLAEKYVTDEEYEIGTVIVVGGEAEVTACTTENAHNVIGVISENPAFLMNRDSEGQAIALKGRVKVKVIGDVKKGDRLIASSSKGYATVNNSRDAWSFAIALEDGVNIIEAVIL